MAAKLVFVYDDFALKSLGATASCSSADSAFPASNLLNPTRKVRMRTGSSPPTIVNIDIDLGTSFNVNERAGDSVAGLGIHDLQTDAAYGSGPWISVYAGPNFSTLASTGALNISPTYWHLNHDWVFEYGTSYPYQCWRIILTNVYAAFSIGKITLGRKANFSFLYSAGSEIGPSEAPITQVEMADGSPATFVRGDKRRTFKLTYNSRTDAERAVLDRLRGQTVPMGLIDSLGGSNQVLIVPGGARFKHVFTGLWDGEIELVQLV